MPEGSFAGKYRHSAFLESVGDMVKVLQLQMVGLLMWRNMMELHGDVQNVMVDGDLLVDKVITGLGRLEIVDPIQQIPSRASAGLCILNHTSLTSETSNPKLGQFDMVPSTLAQPNHNQVLNQKSNIKTISL